jgi:S-adenosylmethionine:tRNA ribosyltransferase-isomerase
VLVSDFDYQLPPELIAQQPAAERAGARMLRLRRQAESGGFRDAEGIAVEDLHFRDLPSLLRGGDLLVMNNTRVFPARLFGHRSGARAQPVSRRNPAAREFLQGTIEVLLTRPLGQTGEWEALVRPGRKIGVGERLSFGSGEADALHAEVIARGEFGERTLRFDLVPDFFERVERIGHVPLPPYIAREDAASDRERYQTVYARERGSVAAPTAGLHFTPGVLDEVRARGVETCEVTLHVGLGTFQPLHAEIVEQNKLHRERYSISGEAAGQINRARRDKRRIVAVGTTTVRTLEYAASLAGEKEIAPGSGEAELFIYPGYEFRVVGALLTNFHLPRSSLLMLVCAFAGRERVLAAYRHAVEQRYRFYSYGDCMFIE